MRMDLLSSRGERALKIEDPDLVGKDPLFAFGFVGGPAAGLCPVLWNYS